MKKTAIAALFALTATTAHAAPVPGLSDVTDNGGGSYTFIFDSVTSDIDGTGMGLSFSGGGINIIAKSDQGRVRQDYPANGGLGVLGRTGSDNLELSLGETLQLNFSRAVEVVGWTLNGLLNGNGHQDAADGRFTAWSDFGSHNSPASLHDGLGVEQNAMCTVNSSFCSTNSLRFGGQYDSFKGYLESVTIRVAPVPVPAALPLMLGAIGGLGFAARKRRRS